MTLQLTFGPPPPARPVTLASAPGAVPWTNRVPTDRPVVFVTIDDGYVQDPAVLAVLEKAEVAVTAFLTVYAVNHHVAYFTRLQELGARIGSHAITHRRLKGEPQWFQQEQLCGSASWLGATFGRAPTLFRPPYGLQDDATLRIARTCGYRAGVHWTHAGDGRFGGPDDHRLLRPGDIILLHFQQDLARSLVDVLTAVRRAGLTPALLDDYLAGS